MPAPFDMSGIATDADGIRHYEGMPPNLVQMLRRSVDLVPDRVAVAELGGDRMTYDRFWQRAARVAGGLRDAGVRPGERVAIRLGNGIDWTLAFFGAQLAQAVVVPVNTRFTEDEVDYVIGDSGAVFTFMPGAPLPEGSPVALDDAGTDDLAAIFYTSGTTGFPKGAMTTHENFVSNAESARRVIGMPRGEATRTLVSVPLFHVTGCNSQFLALTQMAGTTVVMPQFEVQAFLRAIQEERIDNLVSVPAIYWLAINQPNFADFDLSSVRYLSYGGAPIAPDLVRAIMERFPEARVGNGFGLTETSSIATYLPHDWAAEHADSVGFPAPVVDVSLVDVDPRTGVGELLVRGPNVVKGYWNKPEATRTAFTEGWLHTGDLARIDEEGLVYIVDRAKDMINRGGENVYCVEVENVMAGAPGVFEVAVVAVPDTMMGEKVGAVIVPSPGQNIDVEAVIAYTRRYLAEFKVPQYVTVRAEALPRNPGGKVLKPVLRTTTQWGDPLR
ncbi:MAG: class I adenylate-forming enzyme family protein [Acidimicrobiales bacterium]